MKWNVVNKALILSFIAALTFPGVEEARADSLTWGSVSSIPATPILRTAVSSSGSTIVVGTKDIGVYISTNSGSTFTKATAIPNGTYGVAVSGDGQKILAVANGSSTVYSSTNQGQTWISRTTATGQYAACISGDGNTWIAAPYGGNAYLSTSNGDTWTAISAIGTGPWWSCAMSYDGSKRYIQPWNAAIKISTDSGVTWSTSGTVISDSYGISTTTDGSKVLQVTRNGSKAFVSTNSGATFTQLYAAAGNVYAGAISGDGTKIALAVYVNSTGSFIMYSSNGGSTWTQETSAGRRTWYTIAMNDSGTRVIAGTDITSFVYLGVIQSPGSLSLQSISPNTAALSYRRTHLLTVNASNEGKVTFFANGKKIAKCINKRTSSLIATCDYSPAIHGPVLITATLAPTDSSIPVGSSNLLSSAVIARTNTR
jgi:hypothetical protein